MKKENNDYRRKAKVLLFDLEVSPRLSWHYNTYDTTPIKEEQAPILLAVAWKWLGDKEVHCKTLIDDGMKNDPWNDVFLVHDLWTLMDECEVLVSHNIKFDERMANTFFLRHGMPRPSWYKTFCTLQTARRFMRLENNKLDYLGRLLVNDKKTETTYADCWYDMLKGNDAQKHKASELMRKYCAHDVELLEKIYEKLLPFADNHPNMALAAGKYDACPRCGRVGTFKIKTYRKTAAGINAIQYQCKVCKGYVTRKLTREEREELDARNIRTSEFRNQTY